jgi:pimeloyl-ACP methyl ester carboxylesterase
MDGTGKKLRVDLRRIRLAAVVFAASVLVIAISGFVYRTVATARERRLFPPLGRLVDAGGYRLHVHCLGTGSPSVIFESGLSMSSNAWALVQPEVARFTQACSYDRPGYGWSDVPPDPRTGARAAEDLHRMLGNAGIPKPYLLVGHSLGGGQVRLFASRYPKEVAGMVIVASDHEDQRTRKPSAGAEDAGVVRFLRAARGGLARLRSLLFRPTVDKEYAAHLRKYLPVRAAESEIAYLAQSKHAKATSEDRRRIPAIEAQLRAARDFGDIPLIVLSERRAFSNPGSADEIEAARIADELQAEMSRFSRNGKHVRVDSGHMMPLEKPEVIVNAVLEILGR